MISVQHLVRPRTSSARTDWTPASNADPTFAPSGSSATKTGRICVVYATRGRPATLLKSIAFLAAQTRRPDRIIISACSPEDVAIEPKEGLDIVFGPPGLACQRNAAVRRIAPDIDFVVFFDDDFLPHPRWLEVVERCFLDRPRVVAITGHLAVDGIKGPGLSFRDGVEAINRSASEAPNYLMQGFSPYGCNMAFRRSAIADLLFDERLVLYSWLEDRDFGGALAKRGGILVKLGSAIGAHLGVKAGRVSGRRLGYSQVINPLYLHRKGTMTTASLCDHLARNLASNTIKSFAPEPYIDRRGRLAGNIRAVLDIIAGVAAPERAELL